MEAAPRRKTRAECLAQNRQKRKTRAECLEAVRIKRGRAGGDVAQLLDADDEWLCEAARASEMLNSEDDDWVVAAAEACEPAPPILPPAPVIAGIAVEPKHDADAAVVEQRIT